MATAQAKLSSGESVSKGDEEFRLPRPRLDRLDEISASLSATAGELDRTGAFPHAGMRLVYEAGFLTAPVDPIYGGPGASFRDIATILLALGAGDPSVALITAMTMIPHALHARRPWPAGLYRRVVAESARQPTLLNHARAEPDPDPPGRGGLLSTRARRSGDGWLVSGLKRYVTGAEGLSYFLVWATTDEPSPREGIFAVRGTAPGIEIRPAWRQLGMRATGSHEVAFSDVEVADSDVVEIFEPGGGGAERGTASGSAVLVVSSALYLGVARAAQRHVNAYGHQRDPGGLGRPLAATDRFKTSAGEIETLLSTAEQLIFGIADRLDRDDLPSASGALAAKIVIVRNVTAAVELGVRLLGNSGLAQARPLERHFRDIQSVGVHAPQEDVALLAIGSAALAAAQPGK